MRHNLLFLGGGGFIGSNLIKKYINDRYYNIYIIGSSVGNISRINEYKGDVHILQCKIADLQTINSILIEYSINTIVHLVSNLLPNCTFEEYEKELNNILIPTIKLIHICSNLKIKLVYFSSGGAIYGNNANEKFKENNITAPISYYGLSKQIIEHSILLESRKFNLKYLIIRPSNPYGFGQDVNGTQGLIAVAIGKILQNETIHIRGNVSAIRDYIFIDDLSNYFYELMKFDIENQIINIGSGKGYSINDILRFLKQCIDTPLKVDYIESGPDDVSCVVLDVSKLESIINIKSTPIDKGISIFYNQLKSKGK